MSLAAGRQGAEVVKRGNDGEASTLDGPRPNRSMNVLSHINDAASRLDQARSSSYQSAFLGARFDFGRVGIQPKLQVSQPSDAYEQEADRVSEHVMKMQSPDLVGRAGLDDHNPSAPVSMKEQNDPHGGQKRPCAAGLGNSAAIAREIGGVPAGGGSSLDRDTRSFMESRFGYDFGSVRIHNDDASARSASSINALAYTLGNDILFGEGRYQPNTLEGSRLLAHELTHVVQQRGSDEGPILLIQRQAKGPFKKFDEPEELVDYRAEEQVDAALRQSKILWPYIGSKIEKGVRVKGGISYLPRKAFEEKYIANAGNTPESRTKAKDVGGFYDRPNNRIVLPSPTKLENMLHEGIHKFSDKSFQNTFGSGLNEGVTQYFTNRLLQEFGLSPGKAYPEEVVAGEALADVVGLETLALSYFLGPLNIIPVIQSKVPGFDVGAFHSAIRQDPVDWQKVVEMIRPPLGKP